MTEQHSRDLYRLIAAEAGQWEETADGLLYSAGALKDRLLDLVDRNPAGFRRVETNGLTASAMLLLGLAVENMLKAVYIAKDPMLVSEKGLDLAAWKKVGGKGKGAHGSVGLARDLLVLSPNEEDLLHRLQEHVIWAGKYPVPLSPSEYHASRSPVNKLRFSPSPDFATAAALLMRLRTMSRDALADLASV